jgi:hypothetical protein
MAAPPSSSSSLFPNTSWNSAQFLIHWLLNSSKSSGGRGSALAVDWDLVLRRSRAEFWPIMWASWKLWPLVSVVNFALVESVERRNLVSGLAGVAWGVYASMLAARGSRN